MTKNLIRASIVKNLMLAGLIEREGRSAKAAQLHVLNEVLMNLEDIADKNGAGSADPDCWISRGKFGNRTRCHNQPRLSLSLFIKCREDLPRMSSLVW